jgi:tetratricopeptide (TPR) repeat protein
MRKTLAFIISVLLAVSLEAQQRPDALANFRSGRNLELQGRSSEANRAYEEAVRICVEEINIGVSTMDSYAVLTWALQRLGLSAEERGQTNDASRRFNDVISWGERGLKIADDYRIIETMGEAYFYLNNYTQSLVCMQRYVNALPQGSYAPTAYFFIGEIYRIQQKYRYADIAYSTAVTLNDGNALWWYRLGLARENAGDIRPALEAYERSFDLNPGYARTREALQRVRGRAG